MNLLPNFVGIFIMILILSPFLHTYECHSQEVKKIVGNVYDIQENRPLHGAHVYFKVGSLGTTTDINGQFIIHLKGNASLADTLVISFLGYKAQRMALEDLLEEQSIDIFLTLDHVTLKEVTVTPANRKKWTAKGLLDYVVECYNQNVRKTPHIAQAYYREKAAIEGKYVMYTDAIGYSVYGGMTSNWAVLGLYKFYPENMRKSDRGKDWLAYRKYMYGSEKNSDLSYGGSITLNAFQHLATRGILSIEKKGRYKLALKKIEENSQTIYRITFNKPLDKGYIDIWANSLEIKSINCKAKRIWSTAFDKRVIGNIEVTFSYFQNQPFVNQVSTYYKKGNIEHWNQFEVLLQKFDEFEISIKEIGLLNTINPYVLYNRKIWNNYHIVWDESYDKVQFDLGKQKPLASQFIDNANQQYLGGSKKNSRSEKAEELFERLKLFF